MGRKQPDTYQQEVCRCGHDEDEHNLGFFSNRICKVKQCPCEKYQYSHKVLRVRGK